MQINRDGLWKKAGEMCFQIEIVKTMWSWISSNYVLKKTNDATTKNRMQPKEKIKVATVDPHLDKWNQEQN